MLYHISLLHILENTKIKNDAKSVVSAHNASTGLCSTARYNISGCAKENPI